MPLFQSNPALPSPVTSISTTGKAGVALEITGPDFELDREVADAARIGGIPAFVQIVPFGDVLDGSRAFLDQFYLGA